MALLITLVTNGFASVGTSNINVAVPAGGIPAGSVIGAILGCEGSSNLPILGDAVGNTYNTVTIQSGGTPGFKLMYCWNCTAVPSGNLVISNIGSGVNYFYQVFYIVDVRTTSNPFDTAFFNTTVASGTTHSVTALAAPAVAGSLLIGFTGLGASTFQFPTSFNVGWTTIGGGGSGSGSPIMGDSAQKFSSTQDTFTANYSSAFNGAQAIMAFAPRPSATFNLSVSDALAITDTSAAVPRIFNIGSVTVAPAASTTATITVPAGGVPPGSVIILVVNSNGAVSSVTDAASNVYKSNALGGNQGSGYIWWSYTGNALSPGNLITITTSASGRTIAALAYYLKSAMTVVNPFDSTVFNTSVQFGGTGPATLTSSAPWIPGTMLFGVVTSAGSSATGLVGTTSAGWTTQGTAIAGGAVIAGLVTKIVYGADSWTVTMPTGSQNNSIAIFGFSPAYTGISVPQMLFAFGSGQNQSSQVVTTTISVPAGSTLIAVAGAGSGSTMTISDTVGNTYTKTTIPSGGIANKQLWYVANCHAMPVGTVVTFNYTSDISLGVYYIELGISSIIDPFDPTQQVGSTGSISTTATPWSTPSLLVGATWAVRPAIGNVGGTPVSPAGWSGTFPGTGDTQTEWNNFSTTGSNLFVRFKQTSVTETWNPTGYTSGQYNGIFGFNSPYTGISPLRAAGTVSANATSAANTLAISAVTIPAGSLIMVVAGSNATVSSIADSVSNSYTAVSVNSGFKLYYCNHCTALSNGTITITYTSGTTASEVVWAGYATGAGSYDSPYFHTVSTSGATPTITAGAVPIQAKELALALFEENLSPAIQSSTWTLPAGWTKAYTGAQANPIVNYNSGFGGGASIGIAFKQTSVQDTFSPTGMTTGTRPMALAAFQPAGNIFSDTVNEAGTLADSPNGVAILYVSRTEVGTLADAPIGHFITNPPVFESFPAADMPERFAHFSRSIAETGTLADARNAIANMHIAHTDNAPFNDAIIGGFLNLESDAEQLTPINDQDAIIVKVVSDHLNLADSTNGHLLPGNTREDEIEIDDIYDLAPSTYRPPVNEIGNLSDHIISVVFGRPILESVIVRDHPDSRITAHGTISEFGSLNEHIGPENMSTAHVEPITLGENFIGSVRGYEPVENAPLVDHPTGNTILRPSILEQALFLDAPDAISTTLAGDEHANLTDLSDKHVDFAVSVTEFLTLMEDIDSFWNRRDTHETITMIDITDPIIHYAPFHVSEDTSDTSDSQQDSQSLYHSPHVGEMMHWFDFANFRPLPEEDEIINLDDMADVTMTYNVLVSEQSVLFDTIIGSVFGLPEDEQIDVGEMSDAYITRTNRSAMIIPTVRLRSIHDVLTVRENSSDPTNSTDRDPMIYNPPRPPRSRK